MIEDRENEKYKFSADMQIANTNWTFSNLVDEINQNKQLIRDVNCSIDWKRHQIHAQETKSNQIKSVTVTVI